jgi:tRNA(Ile2) C34 agmatinyltransferase TiaS
MIESKNKNVICPKCHRPEVHLDRKNGFHCVACGKKFSSKEAHVLVEHEILQTGTQRGIFS